MKGKLKRRKEKTDRENRKIYRDSENGDREIERIERKR